MKTSNYITILFLFFLFGTLTALHIDSKLYEDTYKEKKAASKKINEASSKFRRLITGARKDEGNIGNWNVFISEAKTYQEDDDNSTFILSSIIRHILDDYKRMDQPEALLLAKNWIEKTIKQNSSHTPFYFQYASILFESGDTPKAISNLKKGIAGSKSKGIAVYYSKTLERYKKHLNDKELKTGDKYIDAIATNLDNENIQLSEVIKNKVVLINFWKPGSLISKNKNRKLFPLYFEYKSKGFEIISLTETHNNFRETHEISERFKELIEIENYPWKNFVDIDKENRIWDQYGVLNTYSRNILVNKKGIILAIDPTAEELKELLNKLL